MEADRMYGAKRQIVESLGFATVQVRGPWAALLVGVMCIDRAGVRTDRFGVRNAA